MYNGNDNDDMPEVAWVIQNTWYKIVAHSPNRNTLQSCYLKYETKIYYFCLSPFSLYSD